jgi:hypothetical protein
MLRLCYLFDFLVQYKQHIDLNTICAFQRFTILCMKPINHFRPAVVFIVSCRCKYDKFIEIHSNLLTILLTYFRRYCYVLLNNAFNNFVDLFFNNYPLNVKHSIHMVSYMSLYSDPMSPKCSQAAKNTLTGRKLRTPFLTESIFTELSRKTAQMFVL